ncbi:uncharacterized protein AMSG_08647 [Thecamonas trahens ATCC 50062]|uniref:Uncharacterized protein n=1 Tax=Thecamonas trahens ATCC 50062 TaxID=461836 RepID=A0A0L0DK31_THETB|nr:hypothetical protein AMSG_08647 [Thecamonas trahens ATCC 50062]KNC52764.1 hypothetical protein AMSG_08647 [Thecamonas trahens ATCC 50062]|eukprot:XP_013755076.1 hypothetical protein AMSG_08647 [Thecamonas trahens ATCC 50062]
MSSTRWSGRRPRLPSLGPGSRPRPLTLRSSRLRPSTRPSRSSSTRLPFTWSIGRRSAGRRLVRRLARQSSLPRSSASPKTSLSPAAVAARNERPQRSLAYLLFLPIFLLSALQPSRPPGTGSAPYCRVWMQTQSRASPLPSLGRPSRSDGCSGGPPRGPFFD